MSRSSTALIWIGVILFFGAYLFPLWSISLDAPQYPEGMGMKIWISKITGEKQHDLQNINGLNHYIGMKEIHADAIPELRFMKYIVAVLIVIGILVGLLRKRALLIFWVALCIVVALVGLVDFYKWGYDYGHDLDPDAPIKVPGMTYQPPLLGQKQLLNITATSLPALGGVMLMAAVALGVVALFLEVRRGRRSRSAPHNDTRTASVAAAVILTAMMSASCSVEPSPIQFGTDVCDFCKMTIADEKYGAEIVTKKGRIYKYDSIECMVDVTLADDFDAERVHSYYTIDFASPGELVEATDAVYLHSPTLRSPMGMNLTSFASTPDAEKVAERHPGKMLAFNDVALLVKDARE